VTRLLRVLARRRLRAVRVLVAVALFSVSQGHAQDVETEARALFERGLELASEARHEEALEHFRQSQGLVPRASTLFNVAVELVQLGRGREALAALDEHATLDPSEQDLRDAAALRTRIREALATLRLEIAPADAEVTVDGEPVPGRGSPRTLVLDPGRRRLGVGAPGHEGVRREVVVRAGESLERRVHLVPRPEEVARVAPEAVPEENSSRTGAGFVFPTIGIRCAYDLR